MTIVFIFAVLSLLMVLMRRPRIRLTTIDLPGAGDTLTIVDNSLLVDYPIDDKSGRAARWLAKHNLPTSLSMINKMSPVVNDYTDKPSLLPAGTKATLTNVRLHYSPGFFRLFQSKSQYRLLTINELRVWVLDDTISILQWRASQSNSL